MSIIAPPRRATLKSVNEYLAATRAGFYIEFDCYNSHQVSKFYEEDGTRFSAGQTRHETARQFLDEYLRYPDRHSLDY